MFKAKKTSATIFLIMIIFLMLSFVVQAASVAYPAVSSKRYLEVTAIKDIPVYKNSSLKTRGTSSPAKQYNAYIERNDKVYVYKIAGAYCYVSYPVGSGRRIGYCNTLDLLFSESCSKKIISQGSCTVYKSYDSTTYFGSIEKKDTIYVVGKAYGRLFVVYDAVSGKRAYKAGWVDKATFEKTINPSISASSAKTYYVKTNGASLILRSGPSTSRSKIATMQNGAKVTVYSINNGWAYLNYNGKYGYASVAYLSLSAPSSAKTSSNENQRRNIVVNYMNQMAQIRWTPSRTFVHWSGTKNGPGYWRAGTTYYGIPYSQACRTTDYATFQKKLSGQRYYGASGQKTYLGSDCSSAISIAWRQVNSGFLIKSTGEMFPYSSQMKKVGSYNTITGNTKRTCTNNGSTKMFDAYKQLKKGDAVLSHCAGGEQHIMLVTSVSSNSITVTHQTTYNSKLKSTWRVNEKWTFARLFSRAYIPVTMSQW